MAEQNLAQVPSPDKSNQVLASALGSNDPFSIKETKTTPVQVPKYVGLKVPDVKKEMSEREAFMKPGNGKRSATC